MVAPIPRTRTRTAAAAPVPETTPAPPAKRIIRQAKPAPAPRQRVRPVSAPVAVTGLITGIVEVERKVSGETVEHIAQHVAVPRQMPDGTTEVAHVMVGGSATIQPVQYESIGIKVSLTLPSRPEPEHYQAAYDEALAFVERTISEQLAPHGRG